MKARSRFEAMREVLEIFLETSYPLDHILKKYLSTRRYIGSKDRQFIQNHLFDLCRHWEEVKWHADLSARSLIISYVSRILKGAEKDFIVDETNISKYDFASLTTDEIEQFNNPFDLKICPDNVSLNVPAFLWSEFEKTYGIDLTNQAEALRQKSTLDLRVNTLKTNREEVLQAFMDLDIEAYATPHSPWGIRLCKRVNLESLDLFKSGHIDVQDEGSQLLTLFCQPNAQDTILDFCAGAGGKTLALAAMMNNCGKIVATDIDIKRLRKIYPRLSRAGVTNVEVQEEPLGPPSASFDKVVVDAPCSGTGTWRRSPDLRARLTLEAYKETLKIQAHLLDQSCHFVKEGGELIYATCSLLASENEDQVAVFLKKHSEFHLIRELRLSPLTHQTDGFYGAVLEKKSS